MAATTAMTAACSGTSSSASAAAPIVVPHGPLEQSTLRIGLVSNELGALPVYVGVDKGLFAAQGVTVTIDDSYHDDASAMEALRSGKVDAVYGDYADYFVAQSVGHLRATIVAEGYLAGDGSVQLVGRTQTNTMTLDDLQKSIKSKGILVPPVSLDAAAQGGTYDVPELMLASAYSTMGDQKFTQDMADKLMHQTAQGLMGDQLAQKKIDAAVLTEPYWTESTDHNALSSVLDLTQGPNQQMPMGGYFTLQDFDLAHLNLMAAFTTGLNQAKQAASDHGTAITELSTKGHYPNMTPTVATSINLGTFPQTVNIDRLGRVLSLLHQWNQALYLNLQTMVPAGTIGLPQVVTATPAK
jgi:NitT/TauT family transport system substrate-binding protein